MGADFATRNILGEGEPPHNRVISDLKGIEQFFRHFSHEIRTKRSHFFRSHQGRLRMYCTTSPYWGKSPSRDRGGVGVRKNPKKCDFCDRGRVGVKEGEKCHTFVVQWNSADAPRRFFLNSPLWHWANSHPQPFTVWRWHPFTWTLVLFTRNIANFSSLAPSALAEPLEFVGWGSARKTNPLWENAPGAFWVCDMHWGCTCVHARTS